MFQSAGLNALLVDRAVDMTGSRGYVWSEKCLSRRNQVVMVKRKKARRLLASTIVRDRASAFPHLEPLH